jgi:lipopolysaccharide transport system ATP-binding protein
VSTPVLTVDNVGKSFRSYRSEWRRVLSWLGVPATPSDEQWALRHVSFAISPGEAIGIVGPNGAGKSTLLKLVAGTLRATEGRLHVRGRVAAILELGIGFNPEFTGRENATYACGLMGIQPDATRALLPDIEAFAEIGEYFDQPSRTYSSGMQVRVAFAVATAVRPDVLVIDEALSVGDAYFQHKSFGRIRSYRAQGTALLFVSHGMQEIRTLCDRVVLLDRGKPLREGPPDEIVDYYNAMVAAREDSELNVLQERQKSGWLRTRSGTGEAAIVEFVLADAAGGAALTSVRVGQRVALTARVMIGADLPKLVLGYMLRDRVGNVIWGTNTWHTRQVVEHPRAGEEVRFRLEFTCTLGPGSYSFSPALVSSDTHLVDNYEWIDNALVFNVVNADQYVFIGSSWLDAAFSITKEPKR